MRVLTGATLVLALAALVQTLFLRRRDGGGHGWRPRAKSAPATDTTRTMAEPVAVEPATSPRSPPPTLVPVDEEATVAVPANPWLSGEAGDGGFLPPLPGSFPSPVGVGASRPPGGADVAGQLGPSGADAGSDAPGSGDSAVPAPDLSFWDLFPDGPPAPPAPPDPGDRGAPGFSQTPLAGVDDRLQNLLAGFPLTGSRPTEAGPPAPDRGARRPGGDPRPSWLSGLDDFARGAPPPPSGQPQAGPPVRVEGSPPPPVTVPPLSSLIAGRGDADKGSPSADDVPADENLLETRPRAGDEDDENENENEDENENEREREGDSEGDDAPPGPESRRGRRRGSEKRRSRRSGRRRRPNQG